MERIKFILAFVWGLPQNLIGFILFLYFKYDKDTKVTRYKGSYVIHYCKNRMGAVSLGQYIFLWSNYGRNTQRVIMHEYGHTRQSHLLGPLYLIVIGLPSIVWNMCFKNYRRRTGKSYYDFYTESWADNWGGVNR